jgi:carbonic anhydrase
VNQSLGHALPWVDRARVSRRRLLGLGAGLAACGLLGGRLAVDTPLAGATGETHWDYHTHGGGDAWGELPEQGSDQLAYPDCNLAQQSPIDIPIDAPLSHRLSLSYRPTPLAVVNNGHTIQVNHEDASTMSVDGKTYDLLQFHFHAPSEHAIEGDRTVMEAHFVHQAGDGEFAVLGVMVVPGTANPAFGDILDVMPHEEGTVAADAKIDAAHLLPDDLSYWAYNGSFTTPPCTEGVKWHVLYEPITVSLSQLADFRDLPFLRHDGEFVGNARPVQPLNGRLAAANKAEADQPAITPPSTGNAGLVTQITP